MADSEINYFGAGMDALRYSRARPHVHADAIRRFRAFAGLEALVPSGLDLACGTGESAVALTANADSVVALDESREMLAHAVRHERVAYARADANRLPIQSSTFHIVTVAQAFHWLSPSAFLTEACRVLRPGGWVVIYTSRFSGEYARGADVCRVVPNDVSNSVPYAAARPDANHTSFG